MGILSRLGIISSRGVFRTLASALIVISQLPFPQLDPFREMLVQIAAFLGGAGIIKAGAAKGGLL